jgi:membrane protein implicated in regulation of membrane protease activity
MNISLTKLPWYAQIGAFVALSVTGVGLFYYYYEIPARADIGAREVTLKSLRGRRPSRSCRNSKPRSTNSPTGWPA